MVRPGGQVAVGSPGIDEGPAVQPWARRQGQTIEARVVEVIGDDRARLELLGLILEARTPLRLRPGATLSVRLGSTIGGVPQLELSPTQPGLGAKGHDGAMPAGAPQRETAARHAQAITALLNYELGKADAVPAAHATAGETISAFAGPREANLDGDVASTSARAAGQDLPAMGAFGRGAGALAIEDGRHVGSSVALPMQIQEPAGTVEMLELHADWEDRPDTSSGNSEAQGGHWVVRCALDSPSHGLVHAVIAHGPEGVSARLWAEQADAALELAGCKPAMQNALAETAIQVERLEIMTGVPPSVEMTGSGGRDRETST